MYLGPFVMYAPQAGSPSRWRIGTNYATLLQKGTPVLQQLLRVFIYNENFSGRLSRLKESGDSADPNLSRFPFLVLVRLHWPLDATPEDWFVF